MTESSSNTFHVGTGAAGGGYEARFVKVEGDVAVLKGDIGDIKAGVTKIGEQVAARGQPNWHFAALVLSALTFAIGAVWILFSTYSSHIEAALDEQKAQAALFKPASQINTENGYLSQIADLKAQLSGKDAAIAEAELKHVAADVEELKKIVVPVSTHQELWATQHKVNDGLAAQIDENRKALADITAPRDTIARFDRRLDALEALARRAQ